MLLGPLVFGAVLAVLFSPVMAIFALMGPALMLGSWAERRWHDRRARHRSAGRRQLSTAAFGLAAARCHGDERSARRRAQPDPATLRRWADGASRLWERRPHHDDAFRLSIGLAHQPWQPWPDDDLPPEPSTASILARLGPLADVPVVAALGPGLAIGLVGPVPARDAALRWLICQVATLHGPADVTLRLLSPTEPGSAWAFVDRLPHACSAPPTVDDPAVTSLPLDLVVVPDASAETLIEPLAHLVGDGPPGRTVLVAADRREQLPSWCTTVVEVTDVDGHGVLHATRSGAVVPDVLVTGLTVASAESWAAALARHRDPEVTSTSAGLPDLVTTDQLDAPITEAAILERWAQARGRPGEVSAPVGVTGRAAGDPSPFTIDLIRDGPHALIGGTTGAGKSELLRTFVLSLALHHPPDALSFLLVDYKGGSAFDACADLPHTVGLVTDLDPHLATRALVALDAEIRRRERTLRAVGVADLSTGAVPSLARLVVVIDEFATLAGELPGFLDALVDVAQRGRSLGVHLVLATQRPHGAISDRIRTNTNLRIALRMLDRAESADVIDDPAAARLPRDRPGRGYARFGHDELVPFQAALTEPGRLRELVEQIARAATAAGVGRAPAPWLPPLPSSLTLDALDRLAGPDDLEGTDGDGNDGGGLAVTVALADEPGRQRQQPWSWHPERGNLLVFGMPGQRHDDHAGVRRTRPGRPRRSPVVPPPRRGRRIGTAPGADGSPSGRHDRRRRRRPTPGPPGPDAGRRARCPASDARRAAADHRDPDRRPPRPAPPVRHRRGPSGRRSAAPRLPGRPERRHPPGRHRRPTRSHPLGDGVAQHGTARAAPRRPVRPDLARAASRGRDRFLRRSATRTRRGRAGRGHRGAGRVVPRPRRRRPRARLAGPAPRPRARSTVLQ